MAKVVPLRFRSGKNRRDLNQLAAGALQQVLRHDDPDAFDDAATELVLAICVILARQRGADRVRHLLDVMTALDLPPETPHR